MENLRPRRQNRYGRPPIDFGFDRGMTNRTHVSAVGRRSYASTQGGRALPLVLPAAAGVEPAATIGGVASKFHRAATILAVLALAAALRAYGLARQSAWADEITTLFIADPSRSFWRSWDLVLSDTHPPLYYLLMRWWFGLFGQSDLAARLPSVIFSVLAVGAAAVAFKPCHLRARLSFALFLAVSPGAIEYAQEARSYSLLLLLATVITGACFRFVQDHGEDRRNATRAITVLTIAGIVASYTHYFGFLIAVAAGLTAVAAAYGNGRQCAAAVAGLASTVATFLPWVIYHTHYMSYGVRMSAWIADFPVSATISWFTRLWLGGTPALIGAMTIAAACLMTPSFRAFARRDAACRVALSLPLMTVAAALAISWYTPVLTSRNLIVVLPALYLAMSSLVDFGAVRWGTPVTTACLTAQLLLMTQSLPWYYTERTKEQWRESAAFVLTQPGCNAGPIYVYGEALNYHYLIEKGRPHLQLVEISVGGGALPTMAPAGDCNVLLWAADLPQEQFDTVLSALPVDRSCVRVAAFYWAFVALREPSGASGDGDCKFAAAPGLGR
jgi:hypothetical protein